MLKQEFIGMPHFDSILIQRGSREIMQILCDNHIAMPYNRGSKNMTIIRIRKFEARNKWFITCNNAIAGCCIHQISCSF